DLKRTVEVELGLGRLTCPQHHRTSRQAACQNSSHPSVHRKPRIARVGHETLEEISSYGRRRLRPLPSERLGPSLSFLSGIFYGSTQIEGRPDLRTNLHLLGIHGRDGVNWPQDR